MGMYVTSWVCLAMQRNNKHNSHQYSAAQNPLLAVQSKVRVLKQGVSLLREGKEACAVFNAVHKGKEACATGSL